MLLQLLSVKRPESERTRQITGALILKYHIEGALQEQV